MYSRILENNINIFQRLYIKLQNELKLLLLKILNQPLPLLKHVRIRISIIVTKYKGKKVLGHSHLPRRQWFCFCLARKSNL